ncbi:MAG TPA: formylglycine-generating enzyme family protein [Vicinamibacterales bacterium]|jgi:formylglycine-generating enzyme required for sulfatase activity|nr:formylglycine-generating enzyme family protein [Vicinamibacterales bacterium]
MRARFACVLVALVAVGFAAPAASPIRLAAEERPSLEVLLERAAWYLDFFVDQFENVVAEESYVQDASTLLPSYSPIVGRGGVSFASPSAAEMARARHRDLRSDFLLVKSPDTQALVPFRDVIDVDGVPVRDRQQRLAKLFLNASPDAMTQAVRIGDEGARYNLGAMRSTIGNPVLALGVLQGSYQPRFKFSLGKEDRGVTPALWVVEFQETQSPAMVRGEAGTDLFSHGRLWIEAATGRVLKTELIVQQPAIRAQITTTFRMDDRFSIAVPNEMREQYWLGTGNKIAMIASYGRFRRFDVRADEDIRMPTRTIDDPLTGMTFVEVPAGRFTMGSAASEPGRNPDEVLHDVTITHPFLLSRYEVTQQEWRAVVGTSPSTFGGCGPRCPVESVTYDEVQRFLQKLNETPRPQASTAVRTLKYRLPTEAEWEYACRAGTTGPFSTGETLTTAQANYNGKFPYGLSAPGDYRQRPVAVGSFPLNAWGLGDMHGNVWEWTADWYAPYDDTPSGNIDPQGAATGEKRVIRGGSWYFDANSARCGLRYTHAPNDKGFSLGFRVAADAR